MSIITVPALIIKKNISFRKYFFSSEQLIFQLQADETKYQMDYILKFKIIKFLWYIDRKAGS
jgi:hypothetical protein